MFHTNPFLNAAEQFTDAAVLLFAASEAVLNQQTNGRTTVTVTLVPSPPPSPYGLLKVEFSYDAGDAALLRTARELREDVQQVESEAYLDVTRTYSVTASLDEDAEDAAERLWDSVCYLRLIGEDAIINVDRISRRAGGDGEELLRSSELVVSIFENYTVPAIHARDWASYAGECAELVADLAEAATGQRPQRDLGPLAS